MAKKKEDSKHYIDNKAFLDALIIHKTGVIAAEQAGTEKPQVPDYIGDCFIKIANHLAYKSNFINYSFREDMILDAIENCLIYMDNFDPKKSSNPFAYFTQITYYAFVRRIQKEKRQLQTKYKYIESLDIDSIIRQAHDEGEYSNAFVSYLKKQADVAHKELSDSKKEKKMPTRKPKYLQSADLDDIIINEADHVELIVDEDSELGETHF
jgi:DNA-directed RNA polymerase specialized sigma24 family protein